MYVVSIYFFTFWPTLYLIKPTQYRIVNLGCMPKGTMEALPVGKRFMRTITLF